MDRIIAKDEHKGKTKYLVKWNGLTYADSTWELAEDIKARRPFPYFLGS